MYPERNKEDNNEIDVKKFQMCGLVAYSSQRGVLGEDDKESLDCT